MLLLLTQLSEKDITNPDFELININYGEIKNSNDTIFEGAKYFSLEDLYEINYGLLESRYYNKVKTVNDELLEVVILRQNSIRQEDGKIELKKSEENIETELEKLNKEEKNKGGKNFIPEKYLLKKNDCLINTRGIPRLITLTDEYLDGDMKFVASHNFITLRPKIAILSALQIDISFLQEMLDIIVNKKIKTRYVNREKIINEIKSDTSFAKQLVESKDDSIVKEFFPEKDLIKKIINSLRTNPKRSISAEIPSLKIDEIKDQKIIVPSGLDQQKKTFSGINQLKDIIKTTEETIELWKNEIYLKNQNI